MKKLISSILVILFLGFIIHYLDLNDKFLYKLFYIGEEFGVIKAKHKKELIVIKEIEENLSGIAHNDDSDTLFAITNSPRDIYELDKNGVILRTIDLKGFKDTEDITYIKDDMFAILDEELNGLFIVNINKDTKVVNIKDCIKKYIFSVKNFENFGLEGISYDKVEDKFYLVNERNPKKIVSIKGIMEDKDIEIKIEDKLFENNHYLSDFSAIHFDDINRRLYILSDESALLGRTDDNEDFTKYFDLSDDEISAKMLHPEGITKDSKGDIYIVGEPNLFLSIKREIDLD